MSAPEKTSNEKRRRLIKSAAAAPVVFTLPSGAALAATSATCDAKSLARFDPGSVQAVVSTAGDGWVRAQFQSWTFRIKGQSSSSIGFNYGSQWYVVSNGSASLVLAEVHTNGANAPRQRAGEYHYVLLNYPDQDLVLDASQFNIAPVAGASCWNSLMPSANIPASNTVILS